MSALYSVWYYYSEDNGAASYTFGPYTVDSLGKLLYVEVGAVFGVGVLELTESTYELGAHGYLIGCQWVVSGSEPQDVVTGSNTNAFLVWGHIRQQSTGYGFSVWPSNGTDALGYHTSFYDTWRGQWPINTNVDFYVSVNSPGDSLEHTISGYLKAVYT